MRQPPAVYVRRRAVLGAGMAAAVLGLTGGARALLAGGAPASEIATNAVGDDPTDEYRTAGWIERENALEGTNDWVVVEDPDAWDRVRGYAHTTSVNREGAVTLFVSTADRSWSASAYRIGYYGGLGGRLLWESGDLEGIEQREPEHTRATGMREARWEPSIDVPVDATWPPGTYLVTLRSSGGGESYVPFTVRDDDSPAPVVIQNSVTTWQAYNDWGGASLYFGGNRQPELRASVVSFDRPYGRNGAGEFFGREFELISLVEQRGLDVTYWTDLDLHERPEQLTDHAGLLTLGHDEYYSTAMRAGLESARDNGVNLAFLGANACYRKIRLEESPLGPHRREVNYRIGADDPLYGEDDDEVTTEWRTGPAPDPESSLVGNFYEANPVEGDMVVADPTHWLWHDTGVEEGTVLEGIVGNEYDRVTPEVPTPENIQVLAHSPIVCKGIPSYADMTYYTHESGAGVLATGTLWWIGHHMIHDVDEGVSHVVRRATENLVRTFGEGPLGDRHPSESNLDDLGIEPGYIDPAPR